MFKKLINDGKPENNDFILKKLYEMIEVLYPKSEFDHFELTNGSLKYEIINKKT
jgi:hypothetical protein